MSENSKPKLELLQVVRLVRSAKHWLVGNLEEKNLEGKKRSPQVPFSRVIGEL
jgi:hypothetical protein